jgi:hypothetical protein
VNNELVILQLARLRGRPSVDDIAVGSGLETDLAAAIVEKLTAEARLQEARGRLRITPDGREQLARLIGEERVSVDHERLASAYARFTDTNTEFKQVLTDWQLINGSPNEHTDPEYDAAVIERLVDLHRRFAPLLQHLGDLAPRLKIYPPRFEAALSKVRAGDHSWLARPLVDSYHTAWFELHEDLISLLGLTRADEAAAGRAE